MTGSPDNHPPSAAEAYLDRTPPLAGRRGRIVIVGGGFAGLACAQALAGSDWQVTLLDRRNHHLFQPLLYQVATAALSPADIAVPLRHLLAHARNVGTVLGDATDINLARRRVQLADGGALPFDVLVLATGSRYSFFGREDWRSRSFSLKSIADARRIRSHVLKRFEEAEACTDPERRAQLLTIVIVGGGPTGVELAGALAELARWSLKQDFRRIDPATTRIVLIEAGPRLLAAFPARLGDYATHTLSSLKVEVRLNTKVEEIDEDGVQAAGNRISAGTILWAAGICAEPLGESLPATRDRQKRIEVAADLSVPGLDRVYVLGDLAHLEQDGEVLPALAQVAQQQGRHLGRELRKDGPAKPFRFHDRGDTAVIGRHAAVYAFGRWGFKGRVAWLLWGVVHVFLLVDFEKRMLVSLQWLWRYLTDAHSARLID